MMWLDVLIHLATVVAAFALGYVVAEYHARVNRPDIACPGCVSPGNASHWPPCSLAGGNEA